MELRDYLGFLRTYWLTIAAFLLVALVLGGLVAATSDKQYESKTQMFVSTTAHDTAPSALVQSGQFSQSRLASYADLISSPLVAERVAAQLGAGLTASTVEKEVSATPLNKTVVLDVTVTDPSAQRAQQIASAVTDVFPVVVKQLEAPGATTESPVKITVIKPATYPRRPTSPSVALDLIIAAVVGICVGVGIAVMRAALDRTVKSAEDVEAATGGATLAVIPSERAAKRRPLLRNDEDDNRLEAIRQLRANLQSLDADARFRTLVCTSPGYGVGKTTTVCNLAIALADSYRRVVLVEADLRRPRAAEYFGTDNSVGLSSVLTGSASLDQAIRRPDSARPLDVIPAGPLAPSAVKMFDTTPTTDLLNTLASRYDFVLLDVPPVLLSADAATLARQCDAALLVARYGETTDHELRAAGASLANMGCRSLGVVVNFAPRRVRIEALAPPRPPASQEPRSSACVPPPLVAMPQDEPIEQPPSTLISAVPPPLPIPSSSPPQSPPQPLEPNPQAAPAHDTLPGPLWSQLSPPSRPPERPDEVHGSE